MIQYKDMGLIPIKSKGGPEALQKEEMFPCCY